MNNEYRLTKEFRSFLLYRQAQIENQKWMFEIRYSKTILSFRTNSIKFIFLQNDYRLIWQSFV